MAEQSSESVDMVTARRLLTELVGVYAKNYARYNNNPDAQNAVYNVVSESVDALCKGRLERHLYMSMFTHEVYVIMHPPGQKQLFEHQDD